MQKNQQQRKPNENYTKVWKKKSEEQKKNAIQQYMPIMNVQETRPSMPS